MDTESDASPQPPVRTTAQVVGINLTIALGYAVFFAIFQREMFGPTGLAALAHALICFVTHIALTVGAKRDPSAGWLASAFLLFFIGLGSFVQALLRGLANA